MVGLPLSHVTLNGVYFCVGVDTFRDSVLMFFFVGQDGHPIKVSKESGHPVEWVREENYMFKLSAFQGVWLSFRQ